MKYMLLVGGGEILDYIGNDNGIPKKYTMMDNNAIQQLKMMPYVKFIILILIIVIAIISVIKLFEVRSPFRGKAITQELEHLSKVRKRESFIISSNNIISTITNIIEKTPLCLDKGAVDYWRYNLERANIRTPGGYRVLKPQEFNACIKAIEVVTIIIFLFIALFVSIPVGVMMIIVTVFTASTIPMMYIRSIVKVKDNEIVENFTDLYLMMHYILLTGSNASIVSVLKSFDKTTNSEEMHNLVNVCVHYIDTYGEYDATRFIARQYREIPQVGKLMRLIRQANDGGDVKSELMGFRSELLAAKKYAKQKRMEKIIFKAKASFNLLMPILIQAVLSAMAIYMKDLSITSSFM